MPLDEIFHTQMSASAAARRAEEEYTAGAMGDRGNFAGGKQPEVRRRRAAAFECAGLRRRP